MKSYLPFFCALTVAVAVVFGSAPAHAQENDHSFEISHELIASDADIEVTQRVRVNSGGESLSTLEFALPVNTAREVSVEYADGSAIPFSSVKKRSELASVGFEHTSLVLDFPQSRNGDWEFVVRFRSDEGVNGFGDGRIILLPFLDGRIGASWSARVVVPRSWPLLNYRPKLHGSTTASNTRSFQIQSEDYRYPVLALSFSATTTHQVKGSVALENTSFLPQTLQATLPLDMHNQSVRIKDISPQPSAVRIDKDGNIIAEYRLWPRQSKTIEYAAVATVEQLRYDGSDSGGVEDIPEELTDYTQLEGYWQASDEMTELAANAMDQGDVYGSMIAMADSLLGELEYTSDTSERLSADEVFGRGSADALGVADVLVTMLRSQGIPARMVHGSTYPSAALHKGAHSWVEAYAPGVGWVHLDPLWARFFGSLGGSGVDRVAWLVEGDFSQAELRNTGSVDIALSPAEADEASDEKIEELFEINNDLFVIFPGVSVWSYSLKNQNEHVIDGVEFAGEGARSLAPQQEVVRRQWHFGGFDPGTVSFARGEEVRGQPAEVHWWPLIAVSVIFLAGGVLQFYRWRKQHYIRKRLAHRNL